MKNKALFLDRDGVIIKMYYHKDLGIIDTPLTVGQVEFVPGIFEFLHLAKQSGYLLVLISNQPGVGIKKTGFKNQSKITNYITQAFKDQGIEFEGQYYCIHHPYASILKYRKECACRKPKTGLLLQASKELNIDLKKSVMIGDGVHDIIAGNKAGCKTILVGNLFEAEYLRILEKNLGSTKPTFIVKKIKEIENLLSSNVFALK